MSPLIGTYIHLERRSNGAPGQFKFLLFLVNKEQDSLFLNVCKVMCSDQLRLLDDSPKYKLCSPNSNFLRNWNLLVKETIAFTN